MSAICCIVCLCSCWIRVFCVRTSSVSFTGTCNFGAFAPDPRPLGACCASESLSLLPPQSTHLESFRRSSHKDNWCKQKREQHAWGAKGGRRGKRGRGEKTARRRKRGFCPPPVHSRIFKRGGSFLHSFQTDRLTDLPMASLTSSSPVWRKFICREFAGSGKGAGAGCGGGVSALCVCASSVFSGCIRVVFII